MSSGGGLFYQFYKFFFSNDKYFWIICTISFFIFNNFIDFKIIKNWIILVILVLFEIDPYFYLDSYDPLFLICLFLLIDTKLINNFIKNISYNKIAVLFSFLFVFWILKCINYYYIYNNLNS